MLGLGNSATGALERGWFALFDSFAPTINSALKKETQKASTAQKRRVYENACRGLWTLGDVVGGYGADWMGGEGC